MPTIAEQLKQKGQLKDLEYQMALKQRMERERREARRDSPKK